MTDEEHLDDAKRRFLSARDDIELIRQRIALDLCPLAVGARIRIEDNGRVYQGLVERIDAQSHPAEVAGPIIGLPSGWAVGGHRFKKGTDELGRWGFGFTNFDAAEIDGVWTLKERSFEAFFNLPKMPDDPTGGG